MRRDVKTEYEFVREMMRDALWNVLYHERELKLAHQQLAIARSAVARTDFSFTDEEASDTYGETADGDACESAEEMIRCLVGRELESIHHRETTLQIAHARFALAKAVLLRLNMPEISMDEIKADVVKSLEPPESK